MERVASNYNFSNIEKLLFNMDEDHSGSALGKLKNELNRFFINAKCQSIIYTMNTDKLFFGMRTYPIFDGGEAIDILTDDRSKPFDKYEIELDSKLFDPMLALDEKELTAILLHEIGHIIYDTATLDEVKAQVDMYFANTGDYLDVKASKGYRELIAYGLKDSVFKIGTIFTKIGDTEMVADDFVAGCGYGAYLESAMRKISRSATYINKEVDNRLITLSWILRLRMDFIVRRIPAIKTLNKAKQMTGSKLEQKEIAYAYNILSRSDLGFHEGAHENQKSRFAKKLDQFKAKGIRAMKDDVYELNVMLRTAEDPEDLYLIIRKVNTDIAIMEDYLTEDISEEERKSILDTIAELHDIRQRAAKDKQVKDRYTSMINVVYY